MSEDTGHSGRRASLMGRFVLFRLTVTSAAMVLLLVGAVFLVPKFEAIYKDMKVTLPAVTVAVFRAARAARSAPALSAPAAAAVLAAVMLLPALLPRPLGYVVTVLVFLALLAAVVVVVGAVFWPYVTMMQSLTDDIPRAGG
ncbi:MAG TPA: hypothetical protein VFJ30_07260 [Phycisphaerae bacterium]|nr:hypothetical protein [Phycisphaerae bacterium]